MTKYRNYTESDIKFAVINSISFAEVLRKLDLVPIGGNYQTIKQRIVELDIDTSHFKGQAWNKGLYKDKSKLRAKQAIKNSLIRERGYQCESCLNKEWLSKPIPLELEHIDGNRMNDDRNNLKLLCCNCHAFTSSWRRRK